MDLPSPVQIVEVGPRDGLQTEVVFIPTSAKIGMSITRSLQAIEGIQKISEPAGKTRQQLFQAHSPHP